MSTPPTLPALPTPPAAYSTADQAQMRGQIARYVGQINAYLTAQERPTTVGKLPGGASVGQRAFVTDATSTTFGAAPVGGGSNVVPIFYNGSEWLIG